MPALGPLEIRILHGVAGFGTLVLALGLMALAVISWTHTELRPITGSFIVLGGLASYVLSNLGGFLIGMILIVVGGSLIIAWGPKNQDRDGARAGDSLGGDHDDADPTGDDTAMSRRSRLRVLRLACVSLTVGLILAPSAAAASPAHDPWLPPLPWPLDEGPADPDEPADPENPPPPEDPETSECDPESLPQQAPPMPSAQADSDAAAVAACWDSDTGSKEAESRELPTLAGDSPVLRADSMAMSGLDFSGVVTVPTSQGPRRALEFTMDSMRLQGMDQSSAINGTDARLHVINAESMATLSGDVRLYALRVEGELYGAVPVTLTPDSPPPVMVPELVVTDVTTDFFYVRGDIVDLPDLEEPTY